MYRMYVHLYIQLHNFFSTFLLKVVCHVFKNMCNYTFEVMKLQFSTIKIY